MKIKYALDRLGGLVLIIVLAPILGIVALLIKMGDGGTVFFRQTRLGLSRKPFTIWKFRTMVRDADKLLDGDGRVAGVNRISKVGRALRFLSIDEIPQLINIVKGEMSFIGPRPSLVEYVDRYTERQRGRFGIRPGVTGLAQVNGRNTLRWSKRIEYDLQYIENYSLWLDLTICLKTIKVFLLRQGIVIDRNPEQVDDLGSRKSFRGV